MSSSSFDNKVAVRIVIGSFVGFSVFAVIVLCCIRRIKKSIEVDLQRRTNVTSQADMNFMELCKMDAATMDRFLYDMAKEKPIRFTAQELHSFTNNYSTRLGSGGFGVVYKGELPNGITFAVKVLKKSSDKRIEEQFMAEIGTIGRTYHINLVRLYGFCVDLHMSALVYEYMENGSLDKFLFSTETPKIEWEKLQEIAIGTAKGLAYLHEDCHQRIIHYDIKPGNVLLDKNLSPKVADFGLAKLCNRDNTHDSVTGYRGTPGYSAPEFILRNYPITHKCDVYSYGMLLFEIVRRRKNLDIVSRDDSVDWFPKKAWEEFEKGRLKDFIVEIGIEEKEKAERMFMVALWCVQDCPDSRPIMSSVVRMLEGGVEILPPANPFRYLYSVGNNVASRDLATSSNTLESAKTDSTWYKDATPLVKKYEIQIVE